MNYTKIAHLSLASLIIAFGALSSTPELLAQQKPKGGISRKEMTTMLMSGIQELQEGKLDSCIEKFNKLRLECVSQLDSKSKAIVDYLLATAYYQKEDWDNALKLLEPFCDLYPKGTEDPDNDRRIDSKISLASVYMKLGQWERARVTLEFIDKSPLSKGDQKLKAKVILTDVLQKEAEPKGDAEKKKALATAELILKTLTQGAPNTPEAIEAKQKLVEIYLKEGKRAEAEALKAEIDSAGSKDPASIIRSNIQGLSLGDAYFQNALEADDEAIRNELLKSALNRYQKVLRKDALVEYFNPAIETVRKKLESFKERVGGAEADMTDQQEAELEKLQAAYEEIEDNKKMVDENKDYDAMISFRIGACLFTLGRTWEAYIAFGDVVENHPDFSMITLATYYYILTERALGRSAKAQEMCRAFVQKYPKADELGEVSLMIGQISFEQGDYIKAIENFEWVKKNVKTLQMASQCELDWYVITSWFARCPWGLGVKAEDIVGMGKPGYQPKLTQATKDTIALIDKFVETYGKKKAFTGAVEEVQYRKGLLYFYSGFYKETVEALETYMKDNPRGQFMPDARYRRAITKFGVKYKDAARNKENLEEVFTECRQWIRDYYDIADKDVMSEVVAPEAKLKADKDLPFAMSDVYNAKESITHQRSEIYMLIGDAYERQIDELSPKGKKARKLTATEEVQKARLVNEMIRAYIIAAKCSRNNSETLDSAMTKLQTLLSQRGEYDRLLELYQTFYDWNPNASAAMDYLNKIIAYTEKKARKEGKEALEKARQDAKKTLADAILRNFDDPAQDNVEVLIDNLAFRLAKNVKRRRVANAETPSEPDPNEYTAAKAADEMIELLNLKTTSPKTTLIGRARGLYARAIIFDSLRNDEERDRNLQSIAITFKPDELSPRILAIVGDYLVRKGKPQDALPFYVYLKDNYRGSTSADFGFYGYGQIMLDQKKYVEAYNAFNDALDSAIAYEKESGIRLGKAIALIEMGPEDARKCDIENKNLQYVMARKELDYIGATKEWRGYMTAASLYYKGQLDERENKYDAAIGNYRICYLTWKKYPEFAAKAMLRTGILFEEKKGQRDAAGQIYYEMNMKDSKFLDTPEAKEAAKRALTCPWTPPAPVTNAPASSSTSEKR
ncbi:MAG: tetratricopeptide repeat protein [Opitutales bacterium]|nr:tetratricopeptide repeat protein [Opitutales bacterium]